MITTIILDADHTLYTPDASKGYDAQFAYLAEVTGVPEEDIRERFQDIIDEIIMIQDPEQRRRSYVLEETFRQLDVEIAEEHVETAVARFWDAVVADLRVPDELEKTLQQLQDDGFVLAVASDEFRDPLLQKLSAAVDDPRSVFELIVSCEDAGSMKPSPSYLTTVLDEVGADPEETVMVGDDWERDLEPADELGAKTILIDSVEGHPDATVADVTEVPDVLEAWRDGS